MQDEAFRFEFEQLAQNIKHELAVTEPNLTITFTPADLPENVMELGVQEGILRSVYAAHNGVYAMSHSMDDLVEPVTISPK